jgi:hypothetical protein
MTVTAKEDPDAPIVITRILHRQRPHLLDYLRIPDRLAPQYPSADRATENSVQARRTERPRSRP